jgi:hypothetical protein
MILHAISSFLQHIAVEISPLGHVSDDIAIVVAGLARTLAVGTDGLAAKLYVDVAVPTAHLMTL